MPLLIIAGGINTILALYGLSHRAINGAKSFIILMLLTVEWALAYAMELSSTNLTIKLFWLQAQYLVIPFVPAIWFYFSLRYTGQWKWFTRQKRNLGFLLVGPTITAVLALTNPIHSLIWQSPTLDNSHGFINLTYTYGWWFWVNVTLAYSFLIVGTIILTITYRQSKTTFKKQIGILIFGAFFPWIGNILQIFNLSPLPGIDLTPLAFTLTGILTAFGMFRYRFLNILPIAHDKIIESMADGILVLDSQDTIIDMNSAAQNISSQPSKNTIGITFNQFLERCRQLSGGSADERGIMTEIIMGTGAQARFYEIQSIKLTGKNDDQTGRLIVLHETTNQKQFEAALHAAKSEAETAAASKSAFLANMSHEIRTPLNGVIGMAELLRNTPLNSEQVELVETIYTSSDTLLAIINNILDFSKIDAGKVELEQEPFDLRDCLEVSLNLISTRINVHSVKLNYYIDELTPNTFIGDVIRLRQVLVNLLNNATKFTEEGEISIHVNSELLDDENYRLHFAVKDTGIGIPDDKKSSLFESFTQADASTTRKYGGTGLGLAISKKLCQLMGGEIGVESQVDRGSTFSFSIIATKSAEQPVRLMQSDQSRLDGKRLLIVAANADIRRSVSRDSRKWGMNPYIAGSGPEALYWIGKSDAFDVAIIDHTIVEKEGQAFAEEVKATHSEPLPLIGIATNNRDSHQDDYSFAAHLPSSFSSSQLNNVLAGVFSTSPAATTSKEAARSMSNNMAVQHPLRILLAEDNRVNQKVATRLLEKLGYEIDVADNGRVALEALEKQPYDVILMDIQMPEMDGVEATNCIRSQWPTENQPRIIAMTAHALEGDREHYLAQGMDDYISKPIQIDKLIESLYNCIPMKAVLSNTPSNPKMNKYFNLADLEALMGDDALRFLETLLPVYLEEAENSLTKMQEALEKIDLIQLKNATHSLKGNSANIALTQIVAMCQKIETLNLHESQGEISSLIDQISHSISEIKLL